MVAHRRVPEAVRREVQEGGQAARLALAGLARQVGLVVAQQVRAGTRVRGGVEAWKTSPAVRTFRASATCSGAARNNKTSAESSVRRHRLSAEMPAVANGGAWGFPIQRTPHCASARSRSGSAPIHGQASSLRYQGRLARRSGNPSRSRSPSANADLPARGPANSDDYCSALCRAHRQRRAQGGPQ